jgi:hypothetical protein
LTFKVRRLSAKEAKFLRRWDAKDNDGLRRALQPWSSLRSTVYARKFPCPRCGGEAYEYLRESSVARLWHLRCFCLGPGCPTSPFDSGPFTPWTGWRIWIGGGVYLFPLRRKTNASLTRLDITVPGDLGGEVVWRRGIATFRTAIQAVAVSPESLYRLGWLQMLKGIA